MENKYETFEQSFPFKLIRTNLDGVYARESLPEDLDVLTASPRTLLKHGILARRPETDGKAALQNTWKKIFAKPRKLITPHLERQVGKSHYLNGAKRAPNGDFTSGNWAGAVLNGPWFSCLGWWQIPTVSKPNETAGSDGGWDSSSWVGSGGNNGSQYLFQAGVQQSVDAKGNAVYIPWYEWVAPSESDDPADFGQVNITNMPVAAGDNVFVSVHYITTAANITYGVVNFFSSVETAGGFSLMLPTPTGFTIAQGEASAEWIMECTNGGYGDGSAFPKFTPLVFTDSFCCGANCTSGDPADADTYNVEPFTGSPNITSVSLGTDAVTITYEGQ